MKSIILAIFGVLVVLSVGGCAQKSSILALKAGKVSDPSIKNIGVMPFENDNIGQSSQLDSTLSGLEISGKKYFNVIDRANLEKVMSEKKLNDSGLVNLINKERDSGLEQMQTLVTGKVIVNDSARSSYREERTDYNTCVESKTNKKGKSYCVRYRKYHVSCVGNTYSVTSNVKFIRVSDAKTIFSGTYPATTKIGHCDDDNIVLPTKNEQNALLAGQISQDILKDIAPSYVSFVVTILDSEDVSYTSAQSTKLKMAIELIKNKRLDKANEVLTSLNNELQGQSCTALYNLAITEESLGNVENAYNLYVKAENISIGKGKVIEEISASVLRSKSNLAELEKAKNQLVK